MGDLEREKITAERIIRNIALSDIRDQPVKEFIRAVIINNPEAIKIAEKHPDIIDRMVDKSCLEIIADPHVFNYMVQELGQDVAKQNVRSAFENLVEHLNREGSLLGALAGDSVINRLHDVGVSDGEINRAFVQEFSGAVNHLQRYVGFRVGKKINEVFNEEFSPETLQVVKRMIPRMYKECPEKMSKISGMLNEMNIEELVGVQNALKEVMGKDIKAEPEGLVLGSYAVDPIGWTETVQT